VAGAGFHGTQLGSADDVWVPLISYTMMNASANGRSAIPATVGLIGRLASGVSIRQAQAEMETIARRLPSVIAAKSPHLHVTLTPYSMTAFGGIAQAGPQFLAVFSVVTMLTLGPLARRRECSQNGQIFRGKGTKGSGAKGKERSFP
jgi:hypothetical protein